MAYSRVLARFRVGITIENSGAIDLLFLVVCESEPAECFGPSLLPRPTRVDNASAPFGQRLMVSRRCNGVARRRKRTTGNRREIQPCRGPRRLTLWLQGRQLPLNDAP